MKALLVAREDCFEGVRVSELAEAASAARSRAG